MHKLKHSTQQITCDFFYAFCSTLSIGIDSLEVGKAFMKQEMESPLGIVCDK